MANETHSIFRTVEGPGWKIEVISDGSFIIEVERRQRRVPRTAVAALVEALATFGVRARRS